MTLLVWCLGACGEAPEATALPEWQFVPDLEIGALEGDSYPFTTVVGVLPGAGGSVLVRELRSSSVPVFDSIGRLEGRVGRAGEGPGEFRSVTRFGWVGDTLWVTDIALARTSYFTESGRPIREERATPPDLGSDLYASPPMPLAGDAAILSPFYVTPQATRHLRIPVLLTTRSGALIDSLAVWDTEVAVQPVSAEGSTFRVTPPFRPRHLVRLSPNGQYVALLRPAPADVDDQVAAELTVFDATGTQVYGTAISARPMPVPDVELQEWIHREAERVSGAALSLASAQSALERVVELPKYLPLADELVVSGEGWTFVRVNSAGGTAWRVIDAAGLEVGQVVVPADVRLAAVAKPHVWGIRQDTLEVTSVVRGRLPVEMWESLGRGRVRVRDFR